MADPTHRQMNVRLPADLIAQVDERRAVRGLSRDEAVRRMLVYALTKPEPSATPTAPGKRTAPRKPR